MADIVGTLATENTLSGSLNTVLGKDGASAYELALTYGFEGTEEEWVKTLNGLSIYTSEDLRPPAQTINIDKINIPQGRKLNEGDLLITNSGKLYVTHHVTDVNTGVTEFDSLRGPQGEQGISGVYLGSGDMPEDCNVQIDPNGDTFTVEDIIEKVIKSQTVKISSVTLNANDWVGETSPYSQAVEISGATENSKINLNPTVEQLNIFYNKDVSFVVENDDGNITVYCIGQKPANDYTMQATITEVVIDG